MKWRKFNRDLHRDLGYFFFGMTIIYSISGIVLNHRKPGGDASLVSRSEIISAKPVMKEKFNRAYILEFLDEIDVEKNQLKNYFFPSENEATIYLKEGHVKYNLDTGIAELITIKKRPVFTEFNFLHYNKPKKLWTWFSDIYAVSLALMAITGVFIIRGKKGIGRRGALFVGAGIIIPVIFLTLYLWAA